MNAKSKLKILLIEDDVADAHLITRELTAAGFNFRLERIEAESELRHEMETEMPDLILSDHGLPSFSGFKALEIVRQTHPRLPFIFISGSNDQGMVAQMYEAGATDYVFKRDIRDLKSAIVEALQPPTQGEQPPVPAPVEPPAAQFELGMYLPPSPAMPPISPKGHLIFCPECHQAWDENGLRIEMANYCGTHSEIVIVRQRCHQCAGTRHAAN